MKRLLQPMQRRLHFLAGVFQGFYCRPLLDVAQNVKKLSFRRCLKVIQQGSAVREEFTLVDGHAASADLRSFLG
jgi:hypothetical protein